MNIYKTVQGDMWDLISYKVYGDEKYADKLMIANYPLLDFFVFPAGVVVKIPEIDLLEEYEFDFPEWRKSESVIK